ncbi:MAG: Tetratricopeptide repeat protein [Acidobacteriota bacterium]|nr:Tetratricopeptide repeat protein [Acidobacteriota bacterium]
MKTMAKTFLALTLVMVLVSSLAAMEWYVHYTKAMKAFESKDWPETIRQIQEALKDKPEPKLKARMTGIDFVDYLPYYYIGVSYYNLGNFKEAQAAFVKSQDFGEIKKVGNLYSNLQRKMEDCQKWLTPPPKEPELKSNQEGGGGKIQETTAAETDAGKVKTDVKPGAQPQAGGKTVLSPAEELIDSGKQLVMEGKYTEAKEKFFAVLQLGAGHQAAEHELHLLAVKYLNEGIRSYFSGEVVKSEKSFREAEQILSRAALAVKRGKNLITAYQFLAVVLIEKYYLGMDNAGNGLEEARSYIARIKSMNPGFELEKKYFSPRVVDIFSGKI